MSLEAYNNLISNIFNTRQVLTKTRSELEEREGQKCWECKRFGHIACHCQNKGGRIEEKKKKSRNRFEVLANIWLTHSQCLEMQRELDRIHTRLLLTYIYKSYLPLYMLSNYL